MIMKELKWTSHDLALSEVEVAKRLVIREPRAATVKEYAQAMRGGTVFPAIEVARIGARLVLVDGMHRLAASTQIERPTIAARVAKMTWAQAGSYAAVANVGHGRPLSSQEAKGRALTLFLQDPANDRLSLREVSRALGNLVGPGTVKNYRDRIRGPLRGSELVDREGSAVAAMQAREERVAEQAAGHLRSLETVFEKMTDTDARYGLLKDLRATLGRMEATGNAEPSEYAKAAEELGI